LLVGATQYFARAADRKQIIELAAKHRLPAMYEWRYHVADGGLMTYSTSEVVLSQRLAAYIDRILNPSLSISPPFRPHFPSPPAVNPHGCLSLP
jgi:hypothetical protein